MKALLGDNKIEIEIHEITMKIDDVLHENLPVFIPVNHDDIVLFLIGIIKKHNKREKKINDKLKETFKD